MRLRLTVNGQEQDADDVWPGESLLYVLRERMGLPGSKNACEQGECGSCTVYLDGVTVCACLVAAGQAQGREVRTVEGLHDGDRLHPLQQAFLDAGAVQCGFCTPGLLVAADDLLRRRRGAGLGPPSDGEIREALAGNLCRCTGYEKILDAVRSAAEQRPDAPNRWPVRVMTEPAESTALEGCSVVTMDGERHEYASGHVVVHGNRITHVGDGAAPRGLPGCRYVDASGCLATPGLVNTHHHLYQWVTRGFAADDTLFGWLTTLYPVWGGLDADIVRTAATGSLAWLARSGCTTTTDHHYVFPRGGGDVFGAEIEAAARVGLRFHPCRGSMDLGRSAGGLPPDSVVEGRDDILAATQEAIDRHHDPSADSMVRVAVAPCSPFSVTPELLTQAAELARRNGVLLHTHLAETLDEQDFCGERFGCTPVEYLAGLGWLGPDVWLAHAVHLDDSAVARLARTQTGVAHCPSSNARLGAGICRTSDLRAAGVRVGLGVDGAASNEASSLLEEVRHALLFARAVGGPTALTVREALELATLGGARVLGRDAELGSLEKGKLADVALWRLDGLGHRDIADPVAALVLGAPPPLELLLVDGHPVVERGAVVTVDETEVAADVAAAAGTLLDRAGVRR